MRKVIVSLALASAALVAAPAASQGYYGGGYNQGYHQGGVYPGDRHLVRRFDSQIGQLTHRIERSAERRAISGQEYRALRQHAARLRERLHRFAYNGLTRGEVEDIADRIDNLRDRIRDERRDGNRYGDRGGYRGW